MHDKTGELEASIDELSVPERMALLAKFARESAPEELAQVVDDWQNSSLFYRRLAIHIAAVAHRIDLLAPHIEDPEVGPTAIVRVTELGAANLVVTHLGDLPRVHRDAFYRVMHRQNLMSVADTIIGSMRDRFGDQEAARIVGACSPAVAAKYLPALIGLVAPSGASSINCLARRAPDVVLRAFNGCYQLDQRSVLLAELTLRPNAVFETLERYISAYTPLDFVDMSAQLINTLAAVDAPRTAALLAQAPQASGHYLLTRVAARRMVKNDTSQKQYVNLLRTLWKAGFASSRGGLCLLRAIPPSRRAEAIGPDLLATVWVDNSVAALLPSAIRHEYARRWLNTHAGDALMRRLPWLALLPLADLEDVFQHTRNPDPNIRQAAYTTLVDAAFRERTNAAIDALPCTLTRLADESDPARLAVATALLRGLKDKPLPDSLRGWVNDLITAVRQAPDTSAATVTALTRLVTSALNNAVLADDADGITWALDQLDELFATETGVLDPLGLSLRTIETAAPLLLTWMRRWPVDHKMAQIRCLHTRRQPEIWDMTAPFLRAELSQGIWQATAIQHYLDDPRHRDERIAEIINVAPPAGYFEQCRDFLAGRRTDLLDPYLVERPQDDSLDHHDDFFIPRPGLIRRWLPRQQTAYVNALASRMFAGETAPTSWSRAARLTAAAQSAPEDRFQRYLAASDAAPVKAGLGTLGRAGLSPDTVAARLLQEANTERAQVAMNALPPALARLNPQRVFSLVRPFLLDKKPAKVTSRKTIIWFVDQLRLPGVIGLMAATLGQPDAHRDVADVAAKVLYRHLDDPSAQAILRILAASNPSAIAGVLRTHPATIAPAGRTALAALTADLLAANDETTRRLARARYGPLAIWAPQGNAVLIGQVLDTRWAQWRPSAQALGVAVGCGGAVDGLLAATNQLTQRACAEAAAAPNTNADMPSLRRLECLISTWSAQRPQPAAAIACMHDVCAALGESELTRPLAVRALVESAFNAAPPHVDERLFAAGAKLCDPWLAALVGQEACDWAKDSDPDRLLALAEQYCKDPAAGLIAMMVAKHSGGWPQTWLDVLTQLRQHTDPAVRAIAYSVDPSKA